MILAGQAAAFWFVFGHAIRFKLIYLDWTCLECILAQRTWIFELDDLIILEKFNMGYVDLCSDHDLDVIFRI